MLAALVALIAVVCAIGGLYGTEAILREVQKIRAELREQRRKK